MGTGYPEKLRHSYLWKYSKPGWVSSQLALAHLDWASGGTGPPLETPSSPNCSEYLWVYSNYCLLKIITYNKQILKESHTACLWGGTHRKNMQMQASNIKPWSRGLFSIPWFLRWNCSSSHTSTQSRRFAVRTKAAQEQPWVTLGTGSLPEGRALCGYPEPNPAWLWHFHPAPGLGALCAAQCPRAALHTRVLQTREGPGAAASHGALPGKGRCKWAFPSFCLKKGQGTVKLCEVRERPYTCLRGVTIFPLWAEL